MKLQGALVLTALMLFGCASVPKTSDAVASQTQSVNDPFQKLTWIVGPFIPYNDHKGYSGRIYLAQATNTSGYAEIVLGVENNTEHRETFTGAAAITGDALTLQQIGTFFDGDQFTEKVKVTIPKDLLRSSANSGLTVRIYGQRRVLDVEVPSYYIAGFIQRI